LQGFNERLLVGGRWALPRQRQAAGGQERRSPGWMPAAADVKKEKSGRQGHNLGTPTFDDPMNTGLQRGPLLVWWWVGGECPRGSAGSCGGVERVWVGGVERPAVGASCVGGMIR